MVCREDFYTILSDTVNQYFSLVCGSDASFSYNSFVGSEKLIINEKFGFVAPFPSPRGLLTFLNNEYNIRGGLLKYVIGHTAAMGVWALPFVGMTKFCYINKGILGKNAFIYPQNRSIRFFDYDSGNVDCIIKSGFSNKYFKNQLDFRLKYSYDFMIPLSEYGDRWFREPILSGHPLARTRDNKLYQKGMQDAMDGIRLLANDTRSYVNADEYAARLLTHIEENISAAIKQKKIKYGKELIRAAKIAAEAVSRGKTVPLCMGHGDFQGGNIWVDSSGKTYIYDWETAGVRSIWYDSSVLNYSLRRAYGWQQLLECPDPALMLLCEDGKDREPFSVMKNTVLLEDIIYYLDDMLELPEDWGAQIFDVFAKSMINLLGIAEEG